MNKAINREAISEAYILGLAAMYAPGGESIYGFDPTLDEAIWPGLINPKWAEDWDEVYGYDPAAAKQLLVDAGYPEGFEFTLYLFTQAGLPEMVDIGQAMALDFAEIGITAYNLVNLEFSGVRGLYRAQAPEINGAVWASRSQHRTNYSLAGSVTTSTTSHRWQREDTDAISAKLGETVDKAGRTALFREWGDIVYYDFMYIQMVCPRWWTSARTWHLEEVGITPRCHWNSPRYGAIPGASLQKFSATCGPACSQYRAN